MKLGVMQPYFLPYIGYFQLINAVDMFVVYDNIKYTKKGWINRNRMLVNETDKMFSLSLKKDSDFLDIVEREIAPDFNRSKLLNQFKGAYSCAPYFSEIFPLLEQIISYEDQNLFRFIHHSLISICKYLNINTEIRISSNIAIDHKLKNQNKVIAFCESLAANTYINAIGGIELYSQEQFQAKGIELKFIKSKPFEYKQFDNDFVPWLSIVDIMMFVPLEIIRDQILNNYELI
jgi:hypothetical protein